MIFRCKLWNSYNKNSTNGSWTDIELIGENFRDAFEERFVEEMVERASKVMKDAPKIPWWVPWLGISRLYILTGAYAFIVATATYTLYNFGFVIPLWLTVLLMGVGVFLALLTLYAFMQGRKRGDYHFWFIDWRKW